MLYTICSFPLTKTTFKIVLVVKTTFENILAIKTTFGIISVISMKTTGANVEPIFVKTISVI